MHSTRVAVLGSLTIHGVIGGLLFLVAPTVPVVKNEKSLKVYVVTMDDPDQSAIEEEVVDAEVVEAVDKPPIEEEINEPEQAEEVTAEQTSAQPKSVQEPPVLEPDHEQNTATANKVKVIKVNPYKGIEQLQQKEQEAFFGSRQFDKQAGAPAVRMRTPKAHTQFLSGESEVIYRNQNRRLVKWKGKCYLFDDSMEMAQADLPSSSGRPCPGELSNNEVMLKQSLDKYLK
ncbi:hypothetical protein [Pseudoalteromonas luteoviolacea]|uniref:Uncharacterized protein n=1 Tax=Pseudoalteromonas luteoviolacea S4054 TaxID=1129367 RepID=A0A0F6A6M2_9GAMM|nr:hypothetical protein [Pseudoalteromonas luteoviolacea]AOT06588.1 hypothetical protein S4054249_01225 [Pseudoalteromonas luteoviolacea]AOT11505.1 hypothetical protein S40542_01225 [Pseudoalteromonas luteoviolacea]AOT16418.1 hypothetical protein S4054_01225 [Pseudoalteromonas luteoviolacea]KKE81094.1 hypothetical protein N479_03545 [Pseudoalteromonas luteoviolacea S4054]KZN62498.1 hypothetical protein N481_03390 [Pseudoalteromonas luteoviolacea S4047-1]